MDVNGTHSRRFDARADFHVERARWSERGRGACLEPAQEPRLPPRDRDAALARLAASRAIVVDPFGVVGRIGAGDRAFVHGASDEPVRDEELVALAPPVGTFGHAHLGGRARLALTWVGDDGLGGVVVFDLSRRWQRSVALGRPVEHVHVDGDERVWVVGAGATTRLEGAPLPQPYPVHGDRFEPRVVNPAPLRAVWSSAPSVAFAGRALGMTDDGERLYVLVDRGDDGQHLLARALDAAPSTPWSDYALPGDPLPFATDVAALEPGRLALFTAAVRDDADEQRRDALVVDLTRAPGAPEDLVARERWPMTSVGSPRFVSSVDRRVRYLDASGRVCPLIPLPLPRYVGAGRVELAERGETIVDSGRVGCAWHRLLVEATLPRQCELLVEVRVSESRDELATDGTWAVQPIPVPTSFDDERPTSLGRPPRGPRDARLYDVLLQRPSGRVRELRGRYARIRLLLLGDGRHTPVVHAARVHFPRFSYQREFLPAHFRLQEAPPAGESPEVPPAAVAALTRFTERFEPKTPSDEARRARLAGTDGEDVAARLEAELVDAVGADVRERFFAAFEGLLTPLEGRVAAADRLLDPWTCPARALPWLASFRGMALDTSWPVERQRRRVAEAGRLASTRGTLSGVQLALDVATGGAVARGQVVVVENHRLRRTFATVLGLRLQDDDHPLTLGSMESGHSIVGDTLILAEETARAFLALFDSALATTHEAAAIEEFFDAYAHRVTVLVHASVAELEVVVRRTLDAEIPAHVQWDLFTTDHPFVLGLAPLLAVDTWLERRPTPRRVVLDDTQLTREGLLSNPPALAPRLVGASTPVDGAP